MAKFRTFYTNLFVALGESFWILFAFIVTSLGFSYLVQSSAMLESFFATTQGQLWAGAAIYVVSAAVVLFPVWKRHGKAVIARTLGVDKRPTDVIWWLPFVTWLAYMVATIIVALFAKALLPWVDQTQEQDVGFADLTFAYEYVFAFIALVVLPPIAEELLFRGYLFGRLRGRLGFWMTTLLVSVLFGLVHGQWNVGIDTAVLSIFLCILREKTGTVWASMAVHAIKNGIAYFFLFIAPLLGYNLIQ